MPVAIALQFPSAMKLDLGHLVFGSMLVVGTAFAARPQVSESSLRLLVVWELDNLIARHEDQATPVKLDKEALKEFPSIQAILNTLGMGDGEIDLKTLKGRLKQLDEKQARTLAAFLRFENRIQKKIAAGLDRAQASRPELDSLLKEELDRLSGEDSFPIPAELAARLKLPKSGSYSAKEIREALDPTKELNLNQDDLLSVVSTLRGTAFERLGNEFFSGFVSEIPGSIGEAFRRKAEVQAARAPRVIEERGTTTPEQRFIPPSITGRTITMPRRSAPGRVRFGSAPKSTDGFFAAAPKFTSSERASLTGAEVAQGRKSVSMELGSVVRDPIDGSLHFAPAGLCQATPIERTFGTEDRTCRFVFASAKHCFEHDPEAIQLDGFATPIARENFRIARSSAASGEDFASLQVDAPCSSKFEPVELAPKGSIGAGQLVSLDVQRAKIGSIDGKSFQSSDGSFLGLNAIGDSGMFPGDSGGGGYVVLKDPKTGRAKKYYIGALSSKFTDGHFRDGVGFIARTPDWFYDELARMVAEPLPSKTLLARAGGPTETRNH